MSAQFQRMKRIVVTVVTAGVPVQISVTDKYVRSFIGQAHFANTGSIYIGDSVANAAAANAHAIAAGGNFNGAGDMLVARTVQFNLSEIYVNSDVNGSKFIVTYFEEVLHQ